VKFPVTTFVVGVILTSGLLESRAGAVDTGPLRSVEKEWKNRFVGATLMRNETMKNGRHKIVAGNFRYATPSLSLIPFLILLSTFWDDVVAYSILNNSIHH
jgi:hypothetical protein